MPRMNGMSSSASSRMIPPGNTFPSFSDHSRRNRRIGSGFDGTAGRGLFGKTLQSLGIDGQGEVPAQGPFAEKETLSLNSQLSDSWKSKNSNEELKQTGSNLLNRGGGIHDPVLKNSFRVNFLTGLPNRNREHQSGACRE